MMLTKKKSAARKAAVLQFFLTHPDATGDEAQEALAGGKLTGEKGPPLSQSLLYELRRQAHEQLARHRQVGLVGAPTGAAPSGEALAALRHGVTQVQKALASLPDVSQVIVGRDGAQVIRLEPRRESL
jgi:hypothetical protein